MIVLFNHIFINARAKGVGVAFPRRIDIYFFHGDRLKIYAFSLVVRVGVLEIVSLVLIGEGKPF